MKKIVALVLSLVMVLGLATTAFGAITLWTENESTALCDIYDAEYNTKELGNVNVKFHAPVALKLNKAGVATNVANIPFYTVEAPLYTGKFFVMVNSVPTTAEADDYIFVKAADVKVNVGDAMINQSAADAYFIMKEVDYVYYTATGTAFTAWSDDCEQYPDPETVDALGLPVPYFTLANKTDDVADLTVKYAESQALVVDSDYMVLVDGEVVGITDVAPVKVTAHTWRATKWNALGAATEFTCTNCETVGTVINASINAPAGAKIDRVGDILIAYTMGAKAPAAGDKVESAQTFDAGIAMYVGMSVMAAAGSAVVLKKKD